MKNILLFLTISSCLLAESYYGKIEPLQTYSIKSNVAGQIVYANAQLEGSQTGTEVFVKIDSKSDRNELTLTIQKLKLQEQLVVLNKRIFTKKNHYYKTIQKLTSKSTVEKDNAFYSQANAKVQYIQAQSQYNDLKQRVFVLEKSIKDKSISVPNYLLTKLHVKQGDFVNMGTPIADVQDLSAGVITLFLSPKNALNYKNLVIRVNNKVIDSNNVKVWGVTDTKHVSLHKAEIKVDKPKLFSVLTKITFTKK